MKMVLEKREKLRDEKAFFDAALKGNVEKIEELLKKGVDVNVENIEIAWQGENALWFAISLRRLNVVKFLIDHGIDINHISMYWRDTPLIKAVTHFNNDIDTDDRIIKILLANNADYTILGRAKNTALSLASKDIKIKNIFDEIINYKNSVEEDKKVDALILAITHNGENNSAFTKEDWTCYSLWNNYNKQIIYALDKEVITKDLVLSLIAKVYNMPLGTISKFLSDHTITFNDLKPYYSIAKKEDNKKFGRYYVELQKVLGKPKKSQLFPKEILENIAVSFGNS